MATNTGVGLLFYKKKPRCPVSFDIKKREISGKNVVEYIGSYVKICFRGEILFEGVVSEEGTHFYVKEIGS